MTSIVQDKHHKKVRYFGKARGNGFLFSEEEIAVLLRKNLERQLQQKTTTRQITLLLFEESRLG